MSTRQTIVCIWISFLPLIAIVVDSRVIAEMQFCTGTAGKVSFFDISGIIPVAFSGDMPLFPD